MTTSTLPPRTTYQSQGPFSHGWGGPLPISPGTQDFVYSAIAGGSQYGRPSLSHSSSTENTGLGITNPAGYHSLHSTVSSYGGDIQYTQGAYHDAGNLGKAQSIMQSGLPPTPQTAGLPPDLHTQQELNAIMQRPSSVRPRQPKRLRPKGAVDESGRPIMKRRRSSNTSQTSAQAAQAYQQAVTSESQAEKLREEAFFAKLRKENVPWKEIAKQYEIEFGKKTSEAALQMKRKRLRDSLRVWTDVDVS